MAMKTKEITKNENMCIVGDTGYYSAKEIEKCYQADIDIVVPAPNKERQQHNKGYFGHSDFIYDEREDAYICPNQQKLTKSNSVITKENGTKTYLYRAGSKTCNSCILRDKCIPSHTAYKRVSRSEYSDTVFKHKKNMNTSHAKKLIKKRGSIVEHPFGTLKQTLGWSHFLVRGTEKVSGENALLMFTYNFRRLLNLIGITLFRKLMIAIKEGNIEKIKDEIAAYIAYFRLYLEKYSILMKFYLYGLTISRN